MKQGKDLVIIDPTAQNPKKQNHILTTPFYVNIDTLNKYFHLSSILRDKILKFLHTESAYCIIINE